VPIKYVGGKPPGGAWVPEREEYLIPEIEQSPKFGGFGTIQFRKFQAAFPHFHKFGMAIDIGANVGLWTRVMSRCFRLVTCFEPNPECHEAFEQNMKDIGATNVQLQPVALGEVEGTVHLNNNLRSTGFSHIDTSGLEVQVHTLDSYDFYAVDFIKIDVEGYEYNVVRGAEQTIRKFKPVMILEQKPKNADRYGVAQTQAAKLLTKWGMVTKAVVSGDHIMAWPN
jgi:FkbM family methyltransferase